jgi:hypothetical protein
MTEPRDEPLASAHDDELSSEPAVNNKSSTQSHGTGERVGREEAASTWSKRISPEKIQQAHAMATALGGAVRTGAGSAMSTMGKGASRVADAFSAPPESELSSLIGSANLPELEGDSLVAIARRLDREADLWRQVSLASLSRAGWADRVAQIAAIGAWLVSIATAFLSLAGFVFGAGKSLGNSLLALASVLAVTLGAVVVAWVSGGVRRTQGALAAAALDRADAAERRLQRVGIILTLRAEDQRLFQDALARFEHDTRG